MEVETSVNYSHGASAFVEAAVCRNCAGVGVLLVDWRGEALAEVSEQAATTSLRRLPFEAANAALRLAARLGLDRIVVHVPDRDAVDQVYGRQPTDSETRAGCLSVRALMNAVQGAELRAADVSGNAYAASLARTAAATHHSPAALLPLDAA